jgi:hypothetical protein
VHQHVRDLATSSERVEALCGECRRTTSFDPGPREIAWMEKIPDERLDELVGALALLR